MASCSRWHTITAIPTVYRNQSSDILIYSHLQLAFIALLGTAGVTLSSWTATRQYGYVLYGTTLASAIYASIILLFVPSGWYATFVLLGLIALTYGIASRERWWWATFVAVLFALLALFLTPSAVALPMTLAWVGIPVAVAIGLRLCQISIGWVAAFYSISVLASLFAVTRVTPFTATNVETLLLICAAVAYVVALVEGSAFISIVPALYMTAAVLFQRDPQALLVLALGVALVGLAAGRIGGRSWSSPAYIASIVVAGATLLESNYQAGFTVIAFLALTAITYLIAVVEARTDVLTGTFVLGAATVFVAGVHWEWFLWQRWLGFIALSWAYLGGQWVWQRYPWLQHRTIGLPYETQSQDGTPIGASVPHTVAAVGAHDHSRASLALGLFATGASLLNGFQEHESATQATVVTLIAVAGLLYLYARLYPQVALLRYVVGFAVAVAATWEMRYLGANNIQAFVIPPGSYLIVAGTLLGGRTATPQAQSYIPGALLTGSLTLLLPTLQQSFVTSDPWLYTVFLASEAIVIVGVGVGIQSRLLVAAGLAFVGLAGLRSAVLAVASGVPVAAVIALFALILMGSATWLNLRARQAVTK